MDKQQMLERIYDVIADKTPNFWCLYKTKTRDVHPLLYREYNLKKNRDEVFLFSRIRGKYCLPTNDCKEIWHPVMIGDVYQWLFDNRMECNVVYAKNPIRWWKVEPYSNNKEFIFHRRENRRKPIDDQSDECIKFVYDLLPTK